MKDRTFLLTILHLALVAASSVSEKTRKLTVAMATGESLNLNCSALSSSDEFSATSVGATWFLGDVLVDHDSDQLVLVSNGTLQTLLSNVNGTHSGKRVTCQYGSTLLTYEIRELDQEIAEVPLKIGDRLELNCSKISTPSTLPDDVTWYHDGTAIPSEMVTILGNSTSQLTIPNVTLGDSGNYSCRSPDNSTLQKFGVLVGLPPKGPEYADCYSHNYKDVICEWSQIPDTFLPVTIACEATFEMLPSYRDWTPCPMVTPNSCSFMSGPSNVHVRLNVSNVLGMETKQIPEFVVYQHTEPFPPRNLTITANSSSELEARWLLPDIYYYELVLSYEMKVTNAVDNAFVLEEVPMGFKVTSHMLRGLKFAGTEYCIHIRSRYDTAAGPWSEPVCAATKPIAPNIEVQNLYYTDTVKEDDDLRDVVVSWEVQKTDMDYPDQGLHGFEISVSSNMSHQRDLTFFNNLSVNDESTLYGDKFNYTVPGLSVNETYIVSLSAFNSGGHSSRAHMFLTAIKPIPQIIKVHLVLNIVIPVAVVLSALLVLALLSFGFQRLKNNSQPIPNPKYHGLTNVKPVRIEHEVFDTLPSLSKDKQHQLLVKLAKEEEEERKRKEESRYRIPSGDSSGIGSEVSHNIIEMSPFLQIRNGSEMSDGSPYCRLSTISPNVSSLPCAPDVVEEALYPLMSPLPGICSPIDEGIFLSESSCYPKSGSDSDAVTPYQQVGHFNFFPDKQPEPTVAWSHFSEKLDEAPPIRGIGQSNSKNERHHSNYAEDADDECSLPSTPASRSDQYISFQTSTVLSDSQQSRIRQGQPLASISPYIDPAHDLSVASTENSGYVDCTNIAIQNTPTAPGYPCGNSRDTSPQSSPEHAVIIHKSKKTAPASVSDPLATNGYIDPAVISSIANAPATFDIRPPTGKHLQPAEISASNSQGIPAGGKTGAPCSLSSLQIHLSQDAYVSQETFSHTQVPPRDGDYVQPEGHIPSVVPMNFVRCLGMDTKIRKTSSPQQEYDVNLKPCQLPSVHGDGPGLYSSSMSHKIPPDVPDVEDETGNDFCNGGVTPSVRNDKQQSFSFIKGGYVSNEILFPVQPPIANNVRCIKRQMPEGPVIELCRGGFGPDDSVGETLPSKQKLAPATRTLIPHDEKLQLSHTFDESTLQPNDSAVADSATRASAGRSIQDGYVCC